MQYILVYVVTLAAFTVIDLVWLMFIGRGFYVAEMGPLLRTDPNLGAAIVFYLIYAVGLVFFAVMPGISEHKAGFALGAGALLGLVAYGTYDLTCLAVIKDFGLRIAIIDLAWGTVLSAVVAGGVTKILA